MQIACRACGANIPPEKLDLGRGIAQCTYCDALMRIAPAEPTGTGETTGPRPEAPQPRGIRIEEDPHSFRIVRRWFTPSIIALLLFTLFWDGFMIVWFTIAITQGVWPMALFGLLHGSIGVGLSYFVLCSFVNSTVIEVDERELSVRHGPLPWPGNRSIATLDIEQLYCRQKTHHGKHGSVNHTFGVFARTRGGKEVPFVKTLTDAGQALFLEQRLEQVMGLTDQPVAGAYTG